MDALAKRRIVFVHDWLTGMRGGEKCLEVLCQHWPDAPLLTLLHRAGSVSPLIEDRPIHTSWLQRFPNVDRYYRYLLPFMPQAAGSWRIPDCDCVLSFSHCVAKAAIPPPGVPHVCYCFTPMRYAWHMRESYFGAASLKSRAIAPILSRIQDWDARTADRVTHFIAISRTIQRRIADCYRRPSVIIYPPVDTEFYCPAPVEREDFYLVVSAFAPYKRIDLAIETCNRLRRKLIVIGTGPQAAKLKSLAGPNTRLLGWQSDETIRDHMRKCRALLFPGEEDFGIVPVEAQACGAPVIAFGRGGATETVLPLGEQRDPTGVWFTEQSVESLADAIEVFEKSRDHLRPEFCRRAALPFSRDRFEKEMLAFLDSVLHGDVGSQRRAA